MNISDEASKTVAKLDVSYNDIAKALDVDKMTVYKWVNGKTGNKLALIALQWLRGELPEPPQLKRNRNFTHSYVCDFTQKLEQIRAKMNVSKAEFSEHLGYSWRYYTDITTGKRKVTDRFRKRVWNRILRKTKWSI